MPIEPALVSFESSLTTDLARVLLGNSITLTPGTLTVEIDGNRFLVHGIVESGATGPVIDEMQRKIAEMLGEPEPPKLRYHVAYTIAGARGGKR
jgi:multicomponent Na+:H+ antiporter subunit E